MRAAPAVAGLLVLVAGRPAGADVADYLGKPIASVRFESEGRDAAEDRLRQMLETRVGRPLSMMEVRQTIAHMFSLGRYEDVRVHASATPNGVALLYELVPVHPVTRIAFAAPPNARGLDQGQLRRAVVERFGASPLAGRAADIARFVEGELRPRGYLHARVTPGVELEHAPDRATLVLAIEPGAQTRIGTIDLVGTPGMPVARLLDRLGIATGEPFERQALDARVAEYIADAHSRGYYEARLMVTPRLADADREANLTVTIIPGPLVRVVFSGDPLPADRLDELVPIAREGAADEDLLEDASNRIEEYLRAQGYRDATAEYVREEGDELLITFDVRRGRHYRIADVVIAGNSSVPLSAFEGNLRLRARQPFEGASLDDDVGMIAELYRRQGFAGVSVRSSVDPLPQPPGSADVLVVVSITIEEGPRTLVGSVRIDRGEAEPPQLSLLGLQPGRPYFLTQMAIDRDAIQLSYANLGYLSATVASNPGLSADGTRADVVFTVSEGPRIFVDHVLVVGNSRTRAETIERELQVKPGDPLGLAAVNESQRRLAALGLFRRTRIAQLGHGDETRRDLLIEVEEAPPTTVGYGVGLEAAQRIRQESGIASARLELAPRAFFEVTRRNLFGKNRSVNVFTRISLRPKDSPFFPGQPEPGAPDSSGFGFSEYRLLTTFREPRVAGTAADAYLTSTVEQQIRTSFNFARRAFSAEVGRRVGRFVSFSGNYQIQRTELFDQQFAPSDALLIDRLFPQVRLSSFALSAIRDTRDDPFEPGAGHYVSATGQLAARRIGSEVGFAKSYFTGQAFRALPRTNRIVFAASARLGVAAPFARRVFAIDDDGSPVIQVVKDLPASERFFAGGDTTVRGFALDQLGTRETTERGFPIGGNALVILNAELRVPIRGGLGVVGFFDTGNVFARATSLDLWQMRSAVGAGVRYQSPVGPIRVDLGLKLNRRDVVPGQPERLTALHISLGQAF